MLLTHLGSICLVNAEGRAADLTLDLAVFAIDRLYGGHDTREHQAYLGASIEHDSVDLAFHLQSYQHSMIATATAWQAVVSAMNKHAKETRNGLRSPEPEHTAVTRHKAD
jgi:hypothetical protein